MFENLIDNGIDIKKMAKYFLVFIIVLLFVGYFISNFLFVDKYVIVDETLILTRRNNNWIQVKEMPDDITDENYTIVGSFGSKKNISIKYDSNNYEWYYFDKDYKNLDVSKVLVSYTDKFKGIKAVEPDVSYYDDNDDEILQKALGNKDLSEFKNSVMKKTYDLDGDGTKEAIYTLTNESLQGRTSSKYSSIFAVSGNNYIGTLDNDYTSPYIVRGIVDLDGDGKYEVIVSKGTIDVATFDTCFQIYSFKNNKFEKIMDCK